MKQEVVRYQADDGLTYPTGGDMLSCWKNKALGSKTMSMCKATAPCLLVAPSVFRVDVPFASINPLPTFVHRVL